MKKDIALITGASSGIGLALAHELAKQGHNLVLTARSEAELLKIARDLARKHGTSATVIAQDFREWEAAEMLYERTSDIREDIGILINNAGLGYREKFWKYDIDRDREMVRVNIEATVGLTKLFLPKMLKRKRGRIMNTASIAGFEPGPLLATYHATKAFVLSFSEALAVEVEDSGVTVTALCPGATDTDFFPKANMIQTKAYQKHKLMAPEDVAEPAYKAMMRGDRVFVPGALNKAMVFARRVTTLPAQARLNKSLYEDAPTQDRNKTPRKKSAGEVPAHRKERLKR